MNSYSGIAIEQALGQHIQRFADQRVYLDAQIAVENTGLLWEKYIFDHAEAIKERIARSADKRTFTNFFVVPGRGAFNIFYALYPHIVEWCVANSYNVPEFLPIIAQSYSGQNRGGKTEIYGLDYYINKGIINEGAHLTIIEDGVDTGSTYRDLKCTLESQGLKTITLDIIALWAKVPKCFKHCSELEEKLTYVHYIDTTEPHPNNWFWIVQAHEWGEVGSEEIVTHTSFKDKIIKGLWDILVSDNTGLGLKTQEALEPANEEMRASFALARLVMDAIRTERIGFPDVVYAIWPDHKFEKLQGAFIAPGVTMHECLVGYFKWLELLDAIEHNRMPRAGINNTDEELGLEFGLISKGPRALPGRDWTVFGRRGVQRALVVANEMPYVLDKATLKEKISANEVLTAAITHSPYFNVPKGKIKTPPDFFLHVNFP